MTAVDTPPAPTTPRSTAIWLATTGLFALVAIGILWAIPRPAEACIAIYPAPPECATGGDPSAIIPILVLIVAVYAAIVTCALLLTRSRVLVLGILSGGLVLLLLIGLGVALGAASPPMYYY